MHRLFLNCWPAIFKYFFCQQFGLFLRFSVFEFFSFPGENNGRNTAKLVKSTVAYLLPSLVITVITDINYIALVCNYLQFYFSDQHSIPD